MSQGGYGGGGGGWGQQPPGGPGGYGPPPGGGGPGYGAPPGGGYGGPPPGQAPYGAPPGAGYGGAPGPMVYMPHGGLGGQRVTFNGPGGDLFGKWFLSLIPLVGPFMWQVERRKWRWSHTTIDGQPCDFHATWSEYLGAVIVPWLLVCVTFGIYTPWMLVRMQQWEYERVTVAGQPGRLAYHATGGEFFGKLFVWQLLSSVTCGIYAFWAIQNFFEYKWSKTTLDNQPFGFRKDVGGWFGMNFVNNLLCNVTCQIYRPWAIANHIKWESEHVG